MDRGDSWCLASEGFEELPGLLGSSKLPLRCNEHVQRLLLAWHFLEDVHGPRLGRRRIAVEQRVRFLEGRPQRRRLLGFLPFSRGSGFSEFRHVRITRENITKR